MLVGLKGVTCQVISDSARFCCFFPTCCIDSSSSSLLRAAPLRILLRVRALWSNASPTALVLAATLCAASAFCVQSSSPSSQTTCHALLMMATLPAVSADMKECDGAAATVRRAVSAVSCKRGMQRTRSLLDLDESAELIEGRIRASCMHMTRKSEARRVTASGTLTVRWTAVGARAA